MSLQVQIRKFLLESLLPLSHLPDVRDLLEYLPIHQSLDQEDPVQHHQIRSLSHLPALLPRETPVAILLPAPKRSSLLHLPNTLKVYQSIQALLLPGSLQVHIQKILPAPLLLPLHLWVARDSLE